MQEARGPHMWAGLSFPLQKAPLGKENPSLQAQCQERKLTSNFSCFLEPGQDSLAFSILFSSPLATPSVFSGGRATAERSE